VILVLEPSLIVNPFFTSTVANKPLKIIHYDLWGPSPIVSHNGYRYYVMFTAAISFNTHFQLLFNKPHDYQFFKVIDCICYPYTRPYSSHKLQPRLIACVFLGYFSVYKGYKCLDLSTNCVYISRHVVFDEFSFPFKDFDSSGNTAVTAANSSSSHNLPLVNIQDFMSDSPTCTIHISLTVPSQPSIIKVYTMRNLKSTTFVPPATPTSSHPMITRAKSKLPTRPKSLMASQHSIHQPDNMDPTTFAQASKEVHWRLAMAKKLDVLAQNNTWTLVPTSEAQNVVDCKWVFKTKRNFGVTVERFNARLVAKGYTQEEGLNFTDTFSLVIKPTTIHLILSLAVTNN
jgi:Reverse transcriptase (RNA-dependent DNA polymerase)